MTEEARMTGATGLDLFIDGREPAEADGWERVWGTASGVTSPAEVVGLDADHRWS
jgi:hypothetical protein